MRKVNSDFSSDPPSWIISPFRLTIYLFFLVSRKTFLPSYLLAWYLVCSFGMMCGCAKWTWIFYFTSRHGLSPPFRLQISLLFLVSGKTFLPSYLRASYFICSFVMMCTCAKWTWFFDPTIYHGLSPPFGLTISLYFLVSRKTFLPSYLRAWYLVCSFVMMCACAKWTWIFYFIFRHALSPPFWLRKSAFFLVTRQTF